MLDDDELRLDPAADADHDHDTESDRRLLCLASCSICAQTCMSFTEAHPVADAEAELARANALADDCADICSATWRFLVRGADRERSVLFALVEACAAAARACRNECERHAASSRASAECAAACWVCEESCDDLARMLAS
ncbi:MAG TPA: hypothetical protein VFG69_03335 [Nannocystaceae bacterium]|nr:hypothetical protein [Nannocystaceae bacterium]